MSDEKPAPLPLSGDEVKEAILFHVNESLNRTCHLISDSAYTSFKAEVTINLKLNDFGREVSDNHIVRTELDTAIPPQGETREVTHELTIEPAPPNEVRVDTNQTVPVRTIENGKMVTKNLRYTPRKKQKQG